MNSGLIKRWSGLLARFLTAQVLTQGFGLVAGLWLLRALPKEEYAWFTLASGWQGTMALLADCGISMALMSIGGRVLEDKGRLGRLIAECVRLRGWLFGLVALGVAPVLAGLLHKAGASWTITLVLALLVLAGAYVNLSMSVYATIPRLCAQHERVLRFDVGGAALRLLLVLGGAWFFPVSITPVFITAFVTVAQWRLANQWAMETCPWERKARSEDRPEIFKLMRTNAPNALYFCLQGQVSLALITWFGRTDQVADVGALGRLAMIFGVFSGVIGTLVAPAFARAKSPVRIAQQYALSVGAFVALGTVLLLACLWFPRPFLLVLGPKYLHLENELFWMVLGIVGANVVAVMWNLNSARGWIRHMWMEIPLSILVQSLACLWLDLSTVRGVLILGCFAPISALLMNAFQSWNGFRALRSNDPSEPV